MHTYTDLCLAHPLETWTPFDIVVISAYALLIMHVTYKPTNVVNSPFIRYSGTSAYSKTMSMDGDFQHVHFWQQGQWSKKHRICCPWYSQVSFKSLKRLSVRSSSKWPTTVLCSMPILEDWERLGLSDSICNADRIYSGEYSFGESIVLLRHKRLREFAILLSTPGMNSSVNPKSLNAMYHRTIIGLGASVINDKYLWYVLIIKKRSRRSDYKYIQE